MMLANRVFAFMALVSLLLALVSSQSDPCHSAHADKKSCLADTKTGGGCAWCECEAVPSACYTQADAARLPPGVYSCTNATSSLLRGVEEY